MCKGCQNGYDEKEEDVLHGCGSDRISGCYAVSFTMAKFVPKGELAAQSNSVVLMTWTLCYGQRQVLFYLRCVDVRPKADVNRETYPTR